MPSRASGFGEAAPKRAWTHEREGGGVDEVRLIVGITGATGAIYGVRLLERLREAGVETHLVISRWGTRTLLHETPYSREQVEALATVVYPPGDMGAAISS